MKHPGLDHFAIAVPDTEAGLKVRRDMLGFPVPAAPAPHPGRQDKRALFPNRAATQGVQVKFTGP
jgi:hypothetical protein